ncbi:MAG: patatin-like phospholipase family protein [Caldimonas sp.]
MPHTPPIPKNPPTRKRLRSAADDQCILVLQGGGALGAYQAGVFEALSQERQTPEWVAGISIGAINAALIAGNPPERRTARLREFWETVSESTVGATGPPPGLSRKLQNGNSAALALLFGAPGFFMPRMPPPAFQIPGSAGAVSYYDTTPLHDTLLRLVDFDLLNDGPMRLSVGAVNVRSGNFAYFDTPNKRLDVRHVMASGALPPGFAPVEIDGEHFWDGGLVSNTPLQYVLDQPGTARRTAFQVDLFPSRGELPSTLAEVDEREKDIRYSSRTRMNTTIEVQQQAIAQAARRLMAKLPPRLRKDPDAMALAALRSEAEVAVVHLIYRRKPYESSWKDYEFSRLSMEEHWDAGRADTLRSLHDPRWTGRRRNATGVQVYDLASDKPTEQTARVDKDALREHHNRKTPAGTGTGA